MANILKQKRSYKYDIGYEPQKPNSWKSLPSFISFVDIKLFKKWKPTKKNKMTYKEIFEQIKIVHLPYEITVEEVTGEVIIKYKDAIMRESCVGCKQDDLWKMVIEKFVVYGVAAFARQEVNVVEPATPENPSMTTEKPLTPTEKIRSNYKPKDAPNETGQPEINRPISKDKL